MALELPGGLFGQEDVRETPVLVNKISYWSCNGCQFHASMPDTDDISYNAGEGWVGATGNGIYFLAPVNLPHNAVVIAVAVYGDASATAESWVLYRQKPNGDSSVLMASANIGTEDTSIANPTIDNGTYEYFIATTTLDAGDVIYGARIKYTTDYD